MAEFHPDPSNQAKSADSTSKSAPVAEIKKIVSERLAKEPKA